MDLRVIQRSPIQGLVDHANVQTSVRYDRPPEQEKAAAVERLHVPYVAPQRGLRGGPRRSREHPAQHSRGKKNREGWIWPSRADFVSNLKGYWAVQGPLALDKRGFHADSCGT